MIEGFCMSKVANCTDSDNAIWSLLCKLNFDLSLCGVVTLYRSIKIITNMLLRISFKAFPLIVRENTGPQTQPWGTLELDKRHVVLSV